MHLSLVDICKSLAMGKPLKRRKTCERVRVRAMLRLIQQELDKHASHPDNKTYFCEKFLNVILLCAGVEYFNHKLDQIRPFNWVSISDSICNVSTETEDVFSSIKKCN